MKLFHVHVAVGDLKQSIGFYSALFAAEPSVIKADYAKWMLDDPRVNFAISTRGRQTLFLIISASRLSTSDELREIYSRLCKADGPVVEQGQTSCCYAKSEKSWIDDPAEFPGRRFTRQVTAPITATSRRAGSANSTREIVLRAGADGRGACRRMRLFMSVSWSNSVATPISAICSCR